MRACVRACVLAYSRARACVCVCVCVMTHGLNFVDVMAVLSVRRMYGPFKVCHTCWERADLLDLVCGV